MHKRVLALLMTLTLSVSMLAGCGKKDAGSGDGSSAGSSDSGAASQYVVTTGDVSYEIAQSVVDAAKPVDVGDLYITDSIYEAAIQRTGNLQLLAGAFEKAAAGGVFTVAYVGGGVTAGLGASDPATTSYTALITDWFKTTFSNDGITAINIGVAGGSSYLENARLEGEVLGSNPDIVFIDAAMSDRNSEDVEGFECIVKTCGEKGIAVVPIMLTNKTYNDVSATLSKICYSFDLPVISYGSVLQTNVTNGTWNWADLYDGIQTENPNDKGHALIASLVTNFFAEILKGENSSKYAAYDCSSAKLQTNARYQAATYLGSDKMTPGESTWGTTDISDPGITGRLAKAWKASDGTAATFKVKGKFISLVYYINNLGTNGNVHVYLDDKYITTLTSDLSENEDYTNNYLSTYTFERFDASGEHTVTFKFAAAEPFEGETLQENISLGSQTFYTVGFITCD